MVNSEGPHMDPSGTHNKVLKALWKIFQIQNIPFQYLIIAFNDIRFSDDLICTGIYSKLLDLILFLPKVTWLHI